MLEGIAASDFHLMGMYKHLGSQAPKLQFAEITKIYNYALENGREHIFVPGDLSDIPRLDEENFSMLVSHLLTWDDTINTYYMQGNHDVEHKFKTSLDVLKILADAGVFKRFKLFSAAETVKIDGVNVSFLPWPHTEVQPAKDDRGRLIFAHVEAAGAIGDNGRALKSGNLDKVKRTKDDYIVSGHIHQYQEMKKNRLTYVGNPYQKNFGEMLPKGFIDFKAGYKKDENSLRFKHTFINNRPNFILENVIIADQGDWNKIKDDARIRYKVYVDKNAGVIVPKNISQMRPNIVMIMGVNTKTTSIEQVAEGAQVSQDLPKINPMSGLKKFLVREGIEDKAKLKLARSYVREAMSYAASQQAG